MVILSKFAETLLSLMEEKIPTYNIISDFIQKVKDLT